MESLIDVYKRQNVRTARDGMPLVMPMYYLHDCREAYEAKTQYYFGTEMIVAPVVNKRNKEGLAPVDVYKRQDFRRCRCQWNEKLICLCG